jgi:hypothetical protein
LMPPNTPALLHPTPTKRHHGPCLQVSKFLFRLKTEPLY